MILQVSQSMEETMRKFVCRFCNKRFPSGKSLGGHIRIHMNQHSSNNRAIPDSSKFKSNDVDDGERKKRKKKRDLSSDYGLRENPRETNRFVHHHPFFTLHHTEKFCRECGKGFSSLKALCGHMACHTEKVEKHKFAMMDAQSDTETSETEDLKRTRFMTLNNNNNNNNNPTSSVSEVEQEDGVEEVAMCLILLSKGFYSHKGRFGLDKESNSDNYSAVFEAKSQSVVDARIGINDCQNKVKSSVYNASEIVKVGKDKLQLKFSDSGYSKYGSKKEDSNVSIHGGFRNDDFNRPKVKDGYGFKDYDVFEPRKMMNRSKNSESKKLVLGNSDNFDSFNSAKQEYLGHNLDDDEVSCKKKTKKKTSFPNHEVYKKDSYDSESYASANKSTDSAADSDSFPYSYQKPKISKNSNNKAKKKVKKSKKTKEHECPICNRTFGSGQALGGHKRSHFVGGGFEEENNNINTGIVQQQESPSSPPSSPVVPCLIDLNLPAPVDE